MLQTYYQKMRVIAVVLASVFMGSFANAQKPDHLTFTAWLSGSQEVPAVNTNGSGVASLVLSPDMKTAYLTAYVTNLSSTITNSHIHEAKMGATGGVVQGLTVTGNKITGMLSLTPATLQKLMMGHYYINVHTTNNPSGEVRGQLMLAADQVFHATMNGGNEVPSVTTNGYGMAVARLSSDSMKLHVHAVFRDLGSTVTSSHLHYGMAGKNGPAVITLSPNLVRGSIDSVYDLSGMSNRKTIIDSLMMGHMYINVHTLNNASGEIRGQMMPVYGPAFDAMLNGAQENPPVTTTAHGLGIFHFSADMDSLMFEVVASGLSGTITGAHLHMAPMGKNGGVVVNLGSFVNGNRISGAIPAANVPMNLFNAFLQGDIYVNIHTANNTGGEIRGQLMGNVHDVYTLTLAGSNEVPAVTTSAMGYGVVTMDRDMSYAHYMAAWSGLSGAPTAAHFHQAMPGQSGGVIHNITTSINNDAAHGYWYNDFKTSYGSLFPAGSVYLNVHTAANPGGEIRGNLIPTTAMFKNMAKDPMLSGKLVFSAALTGAQEVPPVNTNGRGLAGFVLSADMDSMWIMASATGLSGPLQGAHIHESKAGTTGGVLLSLEMMQIGNRFYGVVTGNELSPSLISKMLRGETYINFHTPNNPNGEIRGQIMLEKDHHFHAMMSGSLEVPEVATSGYGIAIARVSQDKKRLHIHAMFNGLSSAVTGAHLHLAPAGKNGGVVLNLGPYMKGNEIVGDIQLGAASTLVDSLMDGKIYINIHTINNPGGEIRGQMMMDKGVSWISMLSGAQEVPPVSTNAMGLGYFALNPGMDTLKYHVVFGGLSSAVTNAHLHKAKVGESGGVILGLKDSMSGNIIKGRAYGTLLTKAMVMDMLQGNIYVNVHSATYGGGEIRGQLIPDVRDAYVFELCPQQEGVAITSKAWGIGVVSVDAMMQNVHFMNVVDSLTSNITGAHFHKAAIGQNGGVVFNMLADNSYTNNYLEGYWTDTSGTILTQSLINDLKAGNLYLNVHTTNNPNGELRGQVVNGALCTKLVGVNNGKMADVNISVYPVPFGESFNLYITAPKNAYYNLKVFDLQGKQVLSENINAKTGSQQINVNVPAGAKGLYLLQLNDEKGNSLSRKLMRH